MAQYSLGIDTSNYKTSIAIVDEYGDIIYNRSEYLDVPLGERGLRQSTAFFMHSNRMPDFVQEALQSINVNDLASIGVSSRPRRIEGSYMPCFLAGLNTARTISSCYGIPVKEFSHQEGHCAAIINNNEPCIFFHLSGGTTEFLLCKEDQAGYDLQIIGGTKDISFGQLIDRIGVSLGYEFPAGKYIDIVASKNSIDNSLFPDIKLKDGYFNLSGVETKITRMLSNASDNEVEDLLSTLLFKIAKLIYQSAINLSNNYNITKVYIAGGVAASSTIRSHISSFKEKEMAQGSVIPNIEIIFGNSELCGDNAIGIAKLASK